MGNDEKATSAAYVDSGSSRGENTSLEDAEYGEMSDLKQGLKQRHIQMIALAGAIGTGLFLGSGKAVAAGGPLGAFLGYLIVGCLVWTVCMSISELSALLPLSGGVIRHAEHFVDPALAFAQGWNVVYSNVVSTPAELVATAVLFQFWISVNNAIWITIFGGLCVISNLLFVGVYGELEFGFSMLKIILILMVNLMGIVLTAGGGPNHQTVGFSYWQNPGPFAQYLLISGSLGQFLGFWKTFSNAAYAYLGVENISTAAAECQNPRRSIPKAAKRIIWRVGIFYVLSIFVVTLNVSPNDPALQLSSGTATQSPFVIAATKAGVPIMPSIINAIIITSAWSSGNAGKSLSLSVSEHMLSRRSGFLNGSRVLYGLAREGSAPKIFTRVNRFGVPYLAVLFFGLFSALGYMTLSDSASVVFDWFQSLVSAAAFVTWDVICIVYLRFYYACKRQGIDRNELPWKGPFQPYTAWAGLISFTVLLFTGGFNVFIEGHWSTQTFVSSYINIPLFIILYFSYKIINKTRIIPLDEVPIRHFLDMAKARPDDPEKPKKGLHKLNILWG